MSARKQELLRAVEALASAHHDWLNSDAKMLTSTFQEAVDDTLATFANGDIPQECRKLFRAADHLAMLWNQWNDKAVEDGDPTALPPQKVWDAIDALYDARKVAEQRDPPPIEPIAQLEKQGLTDKQICRVYGWMLPNRVEDIAKLQDERENPGKHTGENFVHPMVRQQQEADEKRRQARVEFRKAQEAKLAEIASVEPPSIVELVEQKLSARQIGKMFGMSADWVFRECDRLGCARPPLDYEDPRMVRAPAEPAIHEAVERAMDAEQARPTRGVHATDEAADSFGEEPAATSLEDRVIALSNAGQSPAEISATMKASGEPLTPRRVEAILRQFGATLKA